MKTQKTKSLKLVKASIANLDKKDLNTINGGWRNHMSLTWCINSCRTR